MDEFDAAGLIPISLIRWELTDRTKGVASSASSLP